MVFRAIINKIKQGLAKTRSLFRSVAELLRRKGKVDKKFLDELEKLLYEANVGTYATQEIIARVRLAYQDKEVTGEMIGFVKMQLKELLNKKPDPPIISAATGPTVIMVAGVNGAGKTTSIAKLAKWCKNDGKKVMVAACDTFRAAAVEQLTIWSQRLSVDIVKNQQGSDPASVAHDACEKAKSKGYDVLIVDTAGRLHTQTHLMRELEKIRRVVANVIPGARTRCCWCSTPPRVRTRSRRRRCTRRRSSAPASSSPSSTAPPRAARSSASRRSSTFR